MAEQNDGKNESGSALDRYLKKDGNESAATPEMRAPSPFSTPSAEPPPVPGSLNLNISGNVGAAFKPAGFWIRFVAYFIDGIILTVVKSVIGLILLAPMLAKGFSSGGGVGMLESLQGVGAQVINNGLSLVMVYFYYGYFYSKNGATPGKMLFNIKVVRNENGKYLSYWRTFFRETVGKVCSFLTLMIGFIMAAFTEDNRALHDMMFKTRVIRQKARE